jgi:hypothetical protein
VAWAIFAKTLPSVLWVPRIVADIYGARPADLGIVDGIRTIRGGEGHWNGGIALVLLYLGVDRL